MPVPREQRSRGLRNQHQGIKPGDDVGEVTVTTQRPAGGPLSAVGNGGVNSPPGRGRQTGGRSERSASRFAEPMRRYGGPGG